MPTATAVVKVELGKKLFQCEKSRLQSWKNDFGYSGEFSAKVGYTHCGTQTAKDGTVKIVLKQSFRDQKGNFVSNTLKFTDEDALGLIAWLSTMTGLATKKMVYKTN